MKLTTEQLYRIILEEVNAAIGDEPDRFLHDDDDVHGDDEGSMALARLEEIAATAQSLSTHLQKGDQLPAWVQDLISSCHSDIHHIHDYIDGVVKARAKSDT